MAPENPSQQAERKPAVDTPQEIAQQAERLLQDIGRSVDSDDEQYIDDIIERKPGRGIPEHLEDVRDVAQAYRFLVDVIIDVQRKEEKGDVSFKTAQDLAWLTAQIDMLRGRSEIDPTPEDKDGKKKGKVYEFRNEKERERAEELEPEIQNLDRLLTLIEYQGFIMDDVLQSAKKYGETYEALTQELKGDPLELLRTTEQLLMDRIASEENDALQKNLEERLASVKDLIQRLPEARRKVDGVLDRIEDTTGQLKAISMLRLFEGWQQEDRFVQFAEGIIGEQPDRADQSMNELRKTELGNNQTFREFLDFVPEPLRDFPLRILIRGETLRKPGPNGQEIMHRIEPSFRSLDDRLGNLQVSSENSEAVKKNLPKWIAELRTAMSKEAAETQNLAETDLADTEKQLQGDGLNASEKRNLGKKQERLQILIEHCQTVQGDAVTLEDYGEYADNVAWEMREQLRVSMPRRSERGEDSTVVASHAAYADLLAAKDEILFPRMRGSMEEFVEWWDEFRINTDAEVDRLNGRVNYTTKCLALLIANRHYGPRTRPYDSDKQPSRMSEYREFSDELKNSVRREWRLYADGLNSYINEVEDITTYDPSFIEWVSPFRDDGSGIGNDLLRSVTDQLHAIDNSLTNATWWIPRHTGLSFLAPDQTELQAKLQNIHQELSEMQGELITVKDIYESFKQENQHILDAVRNDVDRLKRLQSIASSEELALANRLNPDDSKAPPLLPPEEEREDLKAYIDLIEDEYDGSKKRYEAAEKAYTQARATVDSESRVPAALQKELSEAHIEYQFAQRKLIGCTMYVSEMLQQVHAPALVGAMTQLQQQLKTATGRATAEVHRLDNIKDAPLKWYTGAGVTIGEVIAAYWYGGHGGLRGLPGLKGRVLGLRFFKNEYHRFWKGVANAPGRIVNAPSAAVGDVYNLSARIARWRGYKVPIIPRAEIDYPLKTRIKMLKAEKERLLASNSAQAEELASVTKQLTDVQAKQWTYRIEAMIAQRDKIRMLPVSKQEDALRIFFEKKVTRFQADLQTLTKEQPKMYELLCKHFTHGIDEPEKVVSAIAKIHGTEGKAAKLAAYQMLKGDLSVAQRKAVQQAMRIGFAGSDTVSEFTDASSRVGGGASRMNSQAPQSSQLARNATEAVRKGFSKPTVELADDIAQARKISEPAKRATALSELASDARLVRAAEEGSEEAVELARMSRLAHGSDLVKKGLIGVGVVIDLLFIYDNYSQWQKAVSTGDRIQAEYLEARGYTMRMGAYGGLALLKSSSWTIIGPGAVVLIAGGLIADQYNERDRWLKESKFGKFIQQDSKSLLQQASELDHEDDEEESIVRSRILRAYFYRDTNVSLTQADINIVEERYQRALSQRSESDILKEHGTMDKYMQKIIQSYVRDKIGPVNAMQDAYIRYMTQGSFELSSPLQKERVSRFGELIQLRDSIKPQRSVEYSASDTENKVLDLEPLYNMHVHFDESKDYRTLYREWDDVENLVNEYDHYRLIILRQQVGSMQLQNPEKAYENTKQWIQHRLKHAVLSQDCKLQDAFAYNLGYGDFMRNAVRVHLYTQLNDVFPLGLTQTLLNGDNSHQEVLDVVRRMEKYISRNPSDLYNQIQDSSVAGMLKREINRQPPFEDYWSSAKAAQAKVMRINQAQAQVAGQMQMNVHHLDDILLLIYEKR